MAKWDGTSGTQSADPDWSTLRIFLATIDLGSIARAAARCGIANSAAAKRIQVLEATCGVRLLDRSARGVRPTASGEALARHARALLDLSARLSDDMRALAAGGLGSVRLHATASVIAGHGLGQALAAFAARHPGIQVELREDTSIAVLHDLAEGRADIGLVTGGGDVPSGLEARPWREDRLMAAVPAGHPLAGRGAVRFNEVLDHPMIAVQPGGALALLLDEAAQRLGRRPDYRFRVASPDTGRSLAAAGLGLLVMPDSVLGPFASLLGLQAIPIAEPWAQRQLRLATRPGETLPAPARLLRDHLLAPAPRAR